MGEGDRALETCPIKNEKNNFFTPSLMHIKTVLHIVLRLELYMLAFKTVQKCKLEYHGPPIKVDYTG